MKTYRLTPHPASPPDQVTGVVVDVWGDPQELLLAFRIEGAAALLLPESRPPARKDDLWTTTCFELFLRAADSEDYFEFNLSPSSEWAAYRFTGYREGMARLDLQVEPYVDRGTPADDFIIEADIDLSDAPQRALRIGLSAVIEEKDGTKSYWALRHPPGDKPDFHHPDCFALELPPA